MFFCELLDFCCFDDSFVLEIGFIASYYDGDSRRSVFLKLADPFLDLFEALPGGNLIDDNGSQSLAVVDGSNGVVFFLSGGVLTYQRGTQMANLMVLPFYNGTFF